ncbi:MAG TPA: matrixin family metalloprotease [Candidatus Binatia bacterium]|nr:matrixin family metalloprotease [Candidatus Binatia bacterium]
MTRAGLIAIGVVVATLRPAAGYELERVGSNGTMNPCGNGPKISWPDASASVDLHYLQPAQFQTYAMQAEQRWNQAISTFHFASGRGGFCDGSDGVTSMGFSTTDCAGAAFAGQVVSVTRLFFRTDGTMLDADTTFDVNNASLVDQALFTQIAMHELGHVLGLAHSDACGANGRGMLMQAVTPLGDPRLSAPTADDIAGAKAIYGGGSTSTDGTVPAGANGCAMASPAAERRLATPALLLPIALMLRRRRASRHGDHR